MHLKNIGWKERSKNARSNYSENDENEKSKWRWLNACSEKMFTSAVANTIQSKSKRTNEKKRDLGSTFTSYITSRRVFVVQKGFRTSKSLCRLVAL